jgi:hypothetical protein
MAKITMKFHHSAGEFHGRKAIFNDDGRLATIDQIVNNAVVFRRSTGPRDLVHSLGTQK